MTMQNMSLGKLLYATKKNIDKEAKIIEFLCVNFESTT